MPHFVTAVLARCAREKSAKWGMRRIDVAMSPEGKFDLGDLRAGAIEGKLSWMRAAAGERFAQVELHILLQRLAITNDRDPVLADLAARWGLTTEEVAATPYALVGTVAEIAAQLVARRERFGFSYYTVFDRDMESFAPIVAALSA